MKGKLKQILNKDNILSKISPYDIYRYYLGHDFTSGYKYPSPFRAEKDGSFSVKMMDDGHLVHKDFGGENKGDCFSFVQQLYPGLSFFDVLKKIDRDMKLGIGGEEGYKEITRGYRKDIKKPREKIIIPTIRSFTQEDLDYWKDYCFEERDLERDEIFAASSYKIGKIKVNAGSDLMFAYRFGQYWKIYKPFDPEFKWISNVPLTWAYGLENLKVGEKAIIAKSRKDMGVLRKIYPYVCGVQNESLEAFSEETINHIKENSSEAYYGGDSDVPGKKASYAITEAYGFKHLNVPDKYLKKGIKDFADWVKYDGHLRRIETFLKNKGIL